mmetsp:Transcript_82633/g.242495  ORF Transcript_82633/g.242495 Transcript_82633/m.242495 type:complete len:386 (-) Transcript_82633:98-1255(-)
MELLHLRLAFLSAWPAALFAALPLGGALPAVLVFEGPAYFSRLQEADAARDLHELIACEAQGRCESLEASVLQRVVAVVGQPRNASLLRHLPGLRLVQSTSYMYPALALVPGQAAVASYQCNWREVYGVEPIAEWVLAAVFNWNYRIGERSAKFAGCAWGPDAPYRCPSTEELTAHPVLMNQTLGVLGYGKIGESVARRSAALGMRTVATKAHGPFTPTPENLAWLSNNNDELLRQSDFVVLTLPGSVQGIINRTSLQLMKPGAVVIPVSADPVDFDALYDALTRRSIGGAVVDVWPSGCWHFPDMQCGPPYGRAAEPYPKDIQRLDNAIVLPGMSMRDNKFWVGSAAYAGQNLNALARGLPLQGVVRNATAVVGGPPTEDQLVV